MVSATFYQFGGGGGTHATFMYCMIPGHLASWPWKTFLSWSYAPQRNNCHFLVHRHQVLLWPLSHCLWFFPYAFILLLDQWVSILSAQNLGLKNIWVCKPPGHRIGSSDSTSLGGLAKGIHHSSLGDYNMQVGLEHLWLTSAHSGSNTTSFTWYPSTTESGTWQAFTSLLWIISQMEAGILIPPQYHLFWCISQMPYISLRCLRSTIC